MQYVNLTPALVTGALCVVVTAVAGVWTHQKRGPETAVRVVLWTLLAGAFAGVLVVTLGTVDAVARVPGAPKGVTNLVPLRDIRSMLRSGNRQLTVLNLAGNVALFVPVGLLAGLVARRWTVGVLVGALLSLLVESLQYGLGRSVDVDDLLLNVVGALAGALIGAVLLRLWPVLAGSSKLDRARVQRLER